MGPRDGPQVVHGRVLGDGLRCVDEALALGTASGDHRLLPGPVRLTGVTESAQGGWCRAERRHGVPRPRESGATSQDRPLQLPRPPMWHLSNRQVLHHYAYCHWRGSSARPTCGVRSRRAPGPCPHATQGSEVTSRGDTSPSHRQQIVTRSRDPSTVRGKREIPSRDRELTLREYLALGDALSGSCPVPGSPGARHTRNCDYSAVGARGR